MRGKGESKAEAYIQSIDDANKENIIIDDNKSATQKGNIGKEKRIGPVTDLVVKKPTEKIEKKIKYNIYSFYLKNSSKSRRSFTFTDLALLPSKGPTIPAASS